METKGCPLPVDWLDELEAAEARADFTDHLDRCPSCREVVNRLRPFVGRPLRFDLSGPVEGPRSWTAVPDVAPSFGDIWLSTPFTPGERSAGVVGADLLERGALEKSGLRSTRVGVSDVVSSLMLLVVRADAPAVDVVPLSTATNNAGAVDLLLRPEDTSLTIPLRVVFSCQRAIGLSQLAGRIGALTQPGYQLVERALAGDVDEERVGPALESPDDSRLTADALLQEAIDVLHLQSLDLVAVEGGEQTPNYDVDSPISAPERESAAQVHSFRIEARRTSAPEDARLAAAPADEATLWAVLDDARGAMIEGRLECDALADELRFVIVRVSGIDRPVRLVAGVRDSDKRFETEPFVPGKDMSVVIARGEAIYSSDIESLDLRLGR